MYIYNTNAYFSENAYVPECCTTLVYPQSDIDRGGTVE